jgi:TATA-box binding protein (TBP) (component of TFIID and TFIIIB)
MKFLKTLYRILILTVVVFVLLFLWKFLQKQEIIVTNSTKAVITKLQSVNKLESAQMTITKIMEAKKELVDVIPSISFDNILQDVLFKDKIIFELE